MSQLIREATQAFESAEMPDFIKDKMKGKDEAEDCDDDCDDEKVEEQQIKGPTRTARGMKNSDHKDHFLKGKIASESDEEELEDDEVKVEEEQIKGPRRDPRGIKNSDHKDHPIGESAIKWRPIDNNTSRGTFDNVDFILGHKSHDNMIIKSQDGAVTVPVPVKLCESALGSLQLIDSDPKPFTKWVLNEETCQWEAPIPYPTDGLIYVWNDNKTEWEEQQ
jgi:hypothetical protein